MTLDQLEETGIRQTLSPPSLPPFAPVVGRLMSQLADPEVRFNDVAKLIATDAALSSNVLRLANSALFCRRSEIKTVLHALVMVGLPSLRMMVYTSHIWKVAPISRSELVRMCWRHNLACALLTEHLARDRGTQDQAYTAGLLHGIGQLALVGRYPSEYGRILYFAFRHGLRLGACEQAVFGIDHCALGGDILRKWGCLRAWSTPPATTSVPKQPNRS